MTMSYDLSHFLGVPIIGVFFEFTEMANPHMKEVPFILGY